MNLEQKKERIIKALEQAVNNAKVSMEHAVLMLEFERVRSPLILYFYDSCGIKYINGVNMMEFHVKEFVKNLSRKVVDNLFNQMRKKGEEINKNSSECEFYAAEEVEKNVHEKPQQSKSENSSAFLP